MKLELMNAAIEEQERLTRAPTKQNGRPLAGLQAYVQSAVVGVPVDVVQHDALLRHAQGTVPCPS